MHTKLLKKYYLNWFLIFSLVCFCSPVVYSKSNQDPTIDNRQNVFIFYESVNDEHQEFVNQLLTELTKEFSHYKFQTHDITEPASIETNFKQKDCFVTVGLTPLKVVSAFRTANPIYSTYVSQFHLDKIIDIYANFGSNITGIYQEQSYIRQILLAKSIIPNLENVFLILNRNTRYQLDEYRSVTEKLNLNLDYKIVNLQTSPQIILAKYKNKNSALIVMNDQVHHNKEKLTSLLTTSYRNNIPIIGNRQSDIKYAAMASVYSNDSSLINEISSDLPNFCSDRTQRKAKYLKSFGVNANQQIGDYLGYTSLDTDDLKTLINSMELNLKGKLKND